MRDLIRQVGPCALKLQRDRFGTLVRAIISQQISTSAARSIRARLEQSILPQRICCESLACLSPADLRAAGVSPQKAAYLIDLATRVQNGTLSLRSLSRLPDEAAIESLVQVKGIGVWTAQMFLIFSLGRPDVFAHDDLGIRMALRNLYKLNDLPDRDASLKIAAPWRPFATVASWYCWRSHELPRKKEGTTAAASRSRKPAAKAQGNPSRK